MLGFPWRSNSYNLPSMNAGGVDLIPYQGAKTLHALPHPLPKKNISKRSNILTNSVKTCKKS